MPEQNRVISRVTFSIWLELLGVSGMREQGSRSALEHLGSPRALEKWYFSTRKRLCGESALEQGSTSILESPEYLQ